MKSTDRILAQRYAKAFDAISATAQQAATACAALQQAAALLKQAQAYMQDPAVSSATKIAFVQELFGAEDYISRFLAVLLEEKRYGLLDDCVQQVQQLLDERQGIVRAQVQTAFALSAQQQKQVEDALSKFTGKTARGQFEVRPELLGGLKARVGDVLLDGSLQGQFQKLQEELIK